MKQQAASFTPAIADTLPLGIESRHNLSSRLQLLFDVGHHLLISTGLHRKPDLKIGLDKVGRVLLRMTSIWKLRFSWKRQIAQQGDRASNIFLSAIIVASVQVRIAIYDNAPSLGGRDSE